MANSPALIILGPDFPFTIVGEGLGMGKGYLYLTGQDHNTVPGGITGYSHQAVPHYPRVSSSASLHCAHILLFLFLFHLSTTHLLLSVVSGVSECLGSS